MTHWRVDWKWYLIAPGILIVAHLCALVISLMLGAQIVNPAHLQSLPAYLGVIGPLILFGGWWEEPGWTGYALWPFQERFAHAPFVATLTIGFIRMIWHTPLLLYDTIPWYDYIFGSFALQIILTWLYNRTNGSMLIPMICHLSSNVLLAMMYPLFIGADQGQYWMLMVIAECVIVSGIVIGTRSMLGLKPQRRLLHLLC
jgi:CAAX protease family protein